MRGLIALLAGTALLGAVAACGGDDGPSRVSAPARLAIKVSGSGNRVQWSVPKSVPAGVTRIEFSDAAPGDHAPQLVRVEGGHSLRAGFDAAVAWVTRGRALPDWVHLEGGAVPWPATGTGSATQELAAGNYFILDAGAEEARMAASFDVTGEAGAGELPAPAARIEMGEYAFVPVGLQAGRHPVLIDNTGDEPHFLAAAPIVEGKTIADVRRFFARGEKGPPPIDFTREVSTHVLDGGFQQVVELELRRGTYALLCFVPDREGGPPHAQKGMVSEAVVR